MDGQAAGDVAPTRGDPVGLYFGTTSGELWSSRDEGGSWTCIARHLPEIYAVEAGDALAGEPMKVLIPSAAALLHRNAAGSRRSGATLAEVLDDLDRQFPGIRFRMIDEQERIRPHMRFFVNGAQTLDLAPPLRAVRRTVTSCRP